jgi:WD40 repeat protein
LWDVAAAQKTRSLEGPRSKKSGVRRDGFFLANGTTLLAYDTAGAEDGIYYWNTDLGDQKRMWNDPALKNVTAADLTPDGSVLAAINAAGTLTVWDAQK